MKLSKSLSSTPFFFLHSPSSLDTQDLQRLRIPLTLEPAQVFARSKSLIQIQDDWEQKKGDLTKEYKKRHKEALRRFKKLKKNSSFHGKKKI
jgi:hypothetical protein